MSEYSGVIGRIRDTVNRQYNTIRCDSEKVTQDKNHGIRYSQTTWFIQSHTDIHEIPLLEELHEDE